MRAAFGTDVSSPSSGWVASAMPDELSSTTSSQFSEGHQSPSPSARRVSSLTAGQTSRSASARPGADSRRTMTVAVDPSRSLCSAKPAVTRNVFTGPATAGAVSAGSAAVRPSVRRRCSSGVSAGW